MNFWQRFKRAWDNDEDFEIEFEAWHLLPITGIIILILLNVL